MYHILRMKEFEALEYVLNVLSQENLWQFGTILPFLIQNLKSLALDVILEDIKSIVLSN